MPQSTLYLRQLRFNPKLANSFFAKYILNRRLIVLLLIGIIGWGIASYINIPKVLNPNIKIPIVIVNSTLPGASPNDVESLVTIPLENSIQNVSDIDTLDSTSTNSVSSTVIQFNSGVDPDKAKQDVQSAITGVTLPKDATTPLVEKLDFENVPVWTFSLSSKQNDTASLMRYAKILRDGLKDVPTVNNVVVTGQEQQEIQVVIKPEAISTYNLNPIILSQAITAAANAYPAGTVKTNSSALTLSIDPAVATVEDVRALRITLNSPNGTVSVPISDIATIELRPTPDQSSSYIAGPNHTLTRSVRFDVYKKSTAPITQTVSDAKTYVNQQVSQYNGNFEVSSIVDFGNEINKQYSELIRDLLITVSLVSLALFIFLGIRQALVAALAIPLTFFITFGVMNIANIDLSFIAFFSLLLSLGLLVDDTIVVISAMTAYFRSGKFTPFQTGLLVWKDFLTPIFTTTITTVWAFLPLLLASGIIGEFIKPIPIVVSSTLLGSFLIAIFVTLPLVVFLLKPDLPKRVKVLLFIILILIIVFAAFAILPKNKLYLLEVLAFFLLFFVTYKIRHQLTAKLSNRITTRQKGNGVFHEYFSNGLIHFSIIETRYRRLIARIIVSRRNRRLTIAMVVIFSLFSYFLVPLGFVKNEFFPASDVNYIYVNLELPSGTDLATTNAETISILDKLRKTPDISFITSSSELGLSNTGAGYSSSGQNTALFTIVLPDPSKRSRSSIDIAQDLRNQFQSYTKGKLSVTEQSGGPPAGADVQINLYGSDLSALDTYANKIEDYLKTQPGLVNIDKSIKSGTSKLVFVPDPQKMAGAGLTQDTIGSFLRTFASGVSPKSITLDNESTDTNITIRFNSQTQDITQVTNLNIPTVNGLAPITSLGKFVLEPNPTVINRENSKRTIAVTAGVSKGYSITDANKNLINYVNSKLNLPAGYTWKSGGVNEENQKSVNSILQAMVLSFLLILLTMVLQFKSFRRALIVMLVIPLSISGVFIIFALLHIPLSFPALIGILALFGIVVKNAILIIDKIVHNIDVGIPFDAAIVDGAESRLEPIALTSVTAILGLVPVTLSNALWQGLGGAIIAGLLFSGTIMLFFIPVVYYNMFAQYYTKKLDRRK